MRVSATGAAPAGAEQRAVTADQRAAPELCHPGVLSKDTVLAEIVPAIGARFPAPDGDLDAISRL